tara:strand:- start:232 stop:624 length:393 start_codon:yes stop_codon:yes gene_type:complete
MPSCPVCKDPLFHDKRGDVEIDVCAKHGIWLDQKELFQITEDERRTEDVSMWDDWFRSAVHTPTDHDRKLCCPICECQMKLEKYEGVVIDWCGEHGVWLDSGELDAILNNLRLKPGYLRGVALRLRDLKY